MSEQEIGSPDAAKWKQELEEAADRLWATWETGELGSPELDEMTTQFRQWYAETGEAECLWLLSEIEVYRSRTSRNAAGQSAWEGLSIAPESVTLHDNRVFGLGGIWPDFHKTNYHRLIAEYEIRVARHPHLFIARRILIEHLLADYRLEEAADAFERFFAQQSKPRKIDSLQALLDVYEIRSDRPALLHTLDRILDVYAEDYGIREGSEVELYLHRREQIQ